MRIAKYISIVLLLLMSCSDKETEYTPESPVLHDVTLSFNININPTIDTRGEEFESTDCLQAVSDLRLYLFRSAEGEETPFVLYDIKCPECEESGEEDGVPHLCVKAFKGDHGGENDFVESHTYTIPVKLPVGHYRILAVGREEKPSESKCRINWSGSTEWDEAIMSKESVGAGQLFTGFAAVDKNTPLPIEVKDGGGFYVDITLRRAVAGVFLYVKNIPQTIASQYEVGNIKKGDECYVHEVGIVSAGYETTLSLPWRNPGSDSSFKGTDYTLITTVKPEGEATLLEGKNHYTDPVKKGRFVFPADLRTHTLSNDFLTDDNYSLALCFLGNKEVAGGEKTLYPVRMLPIRIGNTEDIHPDDYSVGENVASMEKAYQLYANHLYSLGNYNESEGTDNPVDLKEALEHGELEIIVVGSWQAIVDIEMK